MRDAAGHGAVAHVPADREAEELEFFAGRDLIEISAEILHADDAVAEHLLVARLPRSPDAQFLELPEFLIVRFLVVDPDILELIELGVSFFAEEFFVFFRDRPACRAEKVHAGHSVVPHSGMQRMIEGLAVHGDALQAVADKPFSCVYAGACRIMIVCF